MGSEQRQDNSFQSLILKLQHFWADQGCIILQPYDMEVGAGTFHPATTLRSLGTRPWAAAYVQPSRRPTDGRYGENPNRLQHYYQYQVLIKPSPPNLQALYLGSLEAIGIDMVLHDIRFVEDDWSIKRLIRNIVLSRTYQLSSDTSEKTLAADGENLLVARHNRRRHHD